VRSVAGLKPLRRQDKLPDMITVKVFALYRKLMGNQKEVTLEVPTPLPTSQALQALFQRYPDLRGALLDDQGDILPHVSVFVDGRDVRHKQGLDTLLQSGDVLALFPPVAGG